MTADDIIDTAAEAAAKRVGLTAVSAELRDAAAAAYALAWGYMLGPLETVTGPEPPLELPYDDAIAQGLIVLTVRLHKDPESPAGALGSEFYAGSVPLPEDLLRHVHHYFDHGRDMRRVVGIG